MVKWEGVKYAKLATFSNFGFSVTAKVVFEKAREGDAFYLSIVKESAEQFAKVVSILIDLFNPEVIVAGGVFMRNMDLFIFLWRKRDKHSKNTRQNSNYLLY